MIRKVVVGGIFTIGAIIFGFILLLRSCLSKYDERSVISEPVIVEEKGKAVVFTLVKFEKTTSYSRNGGMVRKSVSTSYYVQKNDAVTGEKIESRKIKKHSQIKNFPVEVMGLSDNKVWIFAGELMGFDPFTLETIADASIIETKNPALKGKMPQDRRYYEMDKNSGAISITATDGMKYSLNTSSLQALPVSDEEVEKDKLKSMQEAFLREVRELHRLSDSNYSRFRVANQLYSQRKISEAAYRDSSKRFQDERAALSEKEDSLGKLLSQINEEKDAARDISQLANNLERNRSYSQITVNSDSFNRKWYGLYTAEALDKISDQFDFRKVYDDIARNKLYSASLEPKDPDNRFSKWIIGAERKKNDEMVYLQGGFLLDIKTGKPIHLSGPDGFLISSKSQVGNDGLILLNRTGLDGKQQWSLNTGLKELNYWEIVGDRIYVFGTDNKELSSGDINVLHIINLKDGTMVTHDYFKDRNRN